MEEHQLIIVGGGPAGLTAGLYAARARLDVIMLESIAPGGQLSKTYRMDNWPGDVEGISGFELAERMQRHAQHFGLTIKSGTLEALTTDGKDKILTTDQGQYRAKAVLIATGANPATLNIPGETLLTGKGVSYCATCDGPFYRDQAVAVVGGGDTAVEEAIYLTRFASQVMLIHRRDELRATQILQEELLAHKVEKILSTIALAVEGDEQVVGVKVLDLKTNQEKSIPLHGVFIFVGTNPQTSFIAPGLDKNEQGFIITDQGLHTSLPGVFAAGDCRQSYLKQVVTAAGEGALATHMAQKYLELK